MLHIGEDTSDRPIEFRGQLRWSGLLLTEIVNNCLACGTHSARSETERKSTCPGPEDAVP